MIALLYFTKFSLFNYVGGLWICVFLYIYITKTYILLPLSDCIENFVDVFFSLIHFLGFINCPDINM